MGAQKRALARKQSLLSPLSRGHPPFCSRIISVECSKIVQMGLILRPIYPLLLPSPSIIAPIYVHFVLLRAISCNNMPFSSASRSRTAFYSPKQHATPLITPNYYVRHSFAALIRAAHSRTIAQFIATICPLASLASILWRRIARSSSSFEQITPKLAPKINESGEMRSISLRSAL